MILRTPQGLHIFHHKRMNDYYSIHLRGRYFIAFTNNPEIVTARGWMSDSCYSITYLFPQNNISGINTFNIDLTEEFINFSNGEYGDTVELVDFYSIVSSPNHLILSTLPTDAQAKWKEIYDNHR